ncbi:hypothetical protein BV25DRAFT_1914843 [Artomyces pyxidatus]|uniref:Uncharacterized protein n=1 Tax=Artomyces pyxidatus TaxID=48021 RepID=A0ACB8T6Z0_9AGAM|nr:hypothetical protein BV25DRAFT_1914843 [Artomyces pyxidatus]
MLSSKRHPTLSSKTRNLKKPDGRHKALIIGITYRNATAGDRYQPLSGPAIDAHDMESLLLQTYAFRKEDIVVMTDDDDNLIGSSRWPSHENILNAIAALVKGARPGDNFVFHYSGHSGQQTAKVDQEEEDGLDEFLVTCDQKTILDDDLRRFLVDPLPCGTRLTAILDACHSGTLLDLNHYNCNCNWFLRRRNSDCAFPLHSPALSTPTSPAAGVLDEKAVRHRKRMMSADDAAVRMVSRQKVLKKRLAGVMNAARAVARIGTLAKERRIQQGSKSLNTRVEICSKKCRAFAAADGGPVVISLSACADHQITWEDGTRGAAMTYILVEILSKNPSIKVGSLGIALRKELYSAALNRHRHVKKYIKENLGGRVPDDKQTEYATLIVFDVQNPLVGSLRRLSMKEEFLVRRPLI